MLLPNACCLVLLIRTISWTASGCWKPSAVLFAKRYAGIGCWPLLFIISAKVLRISGYIVRDEASSHSIDNNCLGNAGPAWNDKAGGATGYGAHVLTEWAVAQGQI